MLAEPTPRNLFVREIGIWKQLKHPHVLELYGASSASGDPPWFFVSPYAKNGSLTEFLRRVGETLVVNSGGRSRMAALPSLVGMAKAVNRERETISGHGRGSPLAENNRKATVAELICVAGGEVPREWDLFRYMHEIAKGMEYLHIQGVLHGDLKVSFFFCRDNLRSSTSRRRMSLSMIVFSVLSRISDRVR